MPADHRNYGLIWATLTVVLAAMARSAVLKPPRGPRIVEQVGLGRNPRHGLLSELEPILRSRGKAVASHLSATCRIEPRPRIMEQASGGIVACCMRVSNPDLRDCEGVGM
jgi:hypothetical protein